MGQSIQFSSSSGPLGLAARQPAPVARLHLHSAASATPAPWRASLPPGAPQASAEDARAFGRHAVAVADAVAATRQLGGGSAAYAQALAQACVGIADSAVGAGGGAVPSAREVLAAAMDRVGVSGAASVCVAFVDPIR